MQKKDTGHVYAMKMLRKKDMMEKEQVCLIVLDYILCFIIETMFQKLGSFNFYYFCQLQIIFIMLSIVVF